MVGAQWVGLAWFAVVEIVAAATVTTAIATKPAAAVAAKTTTIAVGTCRALAARGRAWAGTWAILPLLGWAVLSSLVGACMGWATCATTT